MQRLAANVYQNISRHADHALAIVRVLTLAKWTPKQDVGAPLQQLLQQVANGWTLGAEQSNPAYSGMTQMGLAICVAHLAHPTHQGQEQGELTSHYTDYIYKLRGLQHQHSTPLFLSTRRHCGHNLHAVQIVDPIMINTANNVAKHLQQGDMWAVLQPAQREYSNRHITNQCDKCYQPGTVRKEWKVTASQLIILQLQPSSGDQYLPVMRAQGQKQEHTIMHHVRNKTAKLWGKRYALSLELPVTLRITSKQRSCNTPHRKTQTITTSTKGHNGAAPSHKKTSHHAGRSSHSSCVKKAPMEGPTRTLQR